MNSAASALLVRRGPPEADGVSERIMFKIPSLGIGDSPELAPEIFNSRRLRLWIPLDSRRGTA